MKNLFALLLISAQIPTIGYTQEKLQETTIRVTYSQDSDFELRVFEEIGPNFSYLDYTQMRAEQGEVSHTFLISEPSFTRVIIIGDPDAFYYDIFLQPEELLAISKGQGDLTYQGKSAKINTLLKRLQDEWMMRHQVDGLPRDLMVSHYQDYPTIIRLLQPYRLQYLQQVAEASEGMPESTVKMLSAYVDLMFTQVAMASLLEAYFADPQPAEWSQWQDSLAQLPLWRQPEILNLPLLRSSHRYFGALSPNMLAFFSEKGFGPKELIWPAKWFFSIQDVLNGLNTFNTSPEVHSTVWESKISSEIIQLDYTDTAVVNQFMAFEKAYPQSAYLPKLKAASQKHFEFQGYQKDEITLPNVRYFNFEEPPTTLAQIIKKPEYEGKVLYIDFWGTWCGSCIEEMKFEKDYPESILPETDDLVRIYIACEWDRATVDIWKRFIKNLQLDDGDHYRMGIYDPQRFTDYPMRGIYPTYFLVDKRGEVHTQDVPAPSEPEELRALVNRMLEE